MEYKKKYTIASDGISEIYYEDTSCKATLVVSDFRDSTLWISARNLINKKNGNLEKMSNKQKFRAYFKINTRLTF